MELVEIGASPSRHVARLADLDRPLRRIFPICRLLDILKSCSMGLVLPSLWDDPREDAAALCMLDGTNCVPGKSQRPLADYLAPAWAQCWSLNPGSDTLLRAYSRVMLDKGTGRNQERTGEGVAVTTTARHLLAASERWYAEGLENHVVVGAVSYLPDAEIGQRIANACNGAEGPKFFCSVQGRAESLLWKRDYFAHEQEVRLLLIGRDWHPETQRQKVITVGINPNEIFTQVSIDPRLNSFEVMERTADFREAGYSGEILHDTNYQKFVYQIMMTKDWPDP